MQFRASTTSWACHVLIRRSSSLMSSSGDVTSSARVPFGCRAVQHLRSVNGQPTDSAEELYRLHHPAAQASCCTATHLSPSAEHFARHSSHVKPSSLQYSVFRSM